MASAENFTTWKMRLLDALMVSVNSREFRVAFCLVQHADQVTMAIYPSQQRVALLLDCSVSAVERAVARLVALGWLERSRKSRQRSNRYRFVQRKVQEALDRRKLLDEEWRGGRAKSRRFEPSDTRAQKRTDQSDVKAPRPSEMTVRYPSEATDEHLHGTFEAEHLEERYGRENSNLVGSGTEVRVDADEWASPRSEDAGGSSLVRRITPRDALHHARLTRLTTRSAVESLDAKFGKSDGEWPTKGRGELP